MITNSSKMLLLRARMERLEAENAELKTQMDSANTEEIVEDSFGNKYEERIVDGTKKLILVESYDGIMNL